MILLKRLTAKKLNRRFSLCVKRSRPILTPRFFYSWFYKNCVSFYFFVMPKKRKKRLPAKFLRKILHFSKKSLEQRIPRFLPLFSQNFFRSTIPLAELTYRS